MPQTTINTHTKGSQFPEFANQKGRFGFVECIYKRNEDGDQYISSVKIKQAKLHKFIRQLGYRSIDINKNRHLVYLKENIMEPVTIQDIRQHVMDYVNSLNFMVHHLNPFLVDEHHHGLIQESFMAGGDRFFNKNNIHTQLYQANCTFTEHTNTAAYFYFKNTAVKVTAKGIEQIEFKSLPGYIWKGQIIDRDYLPNTSNKKGMFETFIDYITGEFGAGYKHKLNPDKKKMLYSMLGYLLHNYKGGERKMVVLTDDSEREDQGRTGKGLILGDQNGGALRHFLGDTLAWINGKTVDIEKPGDFSAAGIDTAVIHLDDLRKDLVSRKIDTIFPLITAGLSTKKLYQDTVHISPKIAASTNKTVKATSDSITGRVWLIALCRYFNAQRSPRDVFKCWFFSNDWSLTEWALFDCTMLQTVQYWFKYGFYIAESGSNYEQIKAQHFDPDFIEWIEKQTDTHHLALNTKYFGGLAHVELNIRECFDEYLNSYKKGRPPYASFNVTRFRELIESYCDLEPNLMSHTEKNRKEHPALFRKKGGPQFISVVFLK